MCKVITRSFNNRFASFHTCKKQPKWLQAGIIFARSVREDKHKLPSYTNKVRIIKEELLFIF